MNDIRSNIDSYWKDDPTKDNLLRPTNRARPGLSTYSQKKKVFDKKPTEKTTIYQPQPMRTKYEKRNINFENQGKPSVYRNKSEVFHVESPVGMMSDRLRSKENFFGSPPHPQTLRNKALIRKTETAKIRHSVNFDEYGMVTQR